MKNCHYRKIIDDYLCAYNTFDVEGMAACMHEDVRFENISNGEVTLATNGIAALRRQAELAGRYFAKRNQEVTAIQLFNERVEVEVRFSGVLAADLPNGQQAGDRIEIKGKSIFKFRGDKIIELTDIS